MHFCPLREVPNATFRSVTVFPGLVEMSFKRISYNEATYVLLFEDLENSQFRFNGDMLINGLPSLTLYERGLPGVSELLRMHVFR